jgi:hypothetical protein
MPRNTESRAISFAIKFIRRKHPRVQWIQSFADERCGRLGVVYQAANFLYCGEHVGTFHELDGVIYHDSILTDSRKKNTPSGSLVRANVDRLVTHNWRQFRYLYFIDRRAIRRLRLNVQPYPKPEAA